MAEENLKTVETVDTRPFRKLVMTIGELPTSYIESMTYYELLTWFVNYLETVIIPTVNNNGEAVEELQQKYLELKANTEQEIDDFENEMTTAFNTLKDFVDNYFDNLDVQEEINNKLDEMAEQGILQEIITTYIQSNVAWTFDTVADMKLATNLVSGSFARTLGFNTINDGGGSLYKITDTGTANEMDIIAVGTGLYANLIKPLILAPEMVGATGDGTTNDTASFARALQLADRIEGNGTYLIDNMTITGKEIRCHLKTAQINGISFDDNVTFSGHLTTTITGNVDSGARGIRIIGDNVTIKDTVFDGVAVGIAVEIHTETYNTLIDNCHFKPNFTYDIWCGGENVSILNCLFDEHTPTSPTPSSTYGCGIKVSQTPDDFAGNNLPDNIIIKNNVIYGHGDNDIDFFTGASNVVLDSNILHNPEHLCVEIKVTTDTTTYPNQHNYNYVITNNIMDGARNIALRDLNTTSKFNRFIVSNNQLHTNTSSCLILENTFDVQIVGNQFSSDYAGTGDWYAINVNNTTNDPMKLFISDCTFDNFVTVITEAASFAYTTVYFNNIKAYNITKFVRPRATDVIYLNNSNITTTANVFNTIEGKVFVSNSTLTGVDCFPVASADAIISAVNCIFNASGYVFRRGGASYLYKYALIACDYSGSANLCTPTSSVTDSVPFTQLT